METKKAVKCSVWLVSTWASAVLGLPSFLRPGDLETIDSVSCTECMCSWKMCGFILLAGKATVVIPVLFDFCLPGGEGRSWEEFRPVH